MADFTNQCACILSVLSASRWIGTALGEVFDSVSINHVSYIAAAFLTYCFLRKYAVTSVRHLIERSVSSCLLFGAMPAFTICSNMLDSSLSRHKKNLNHYGRCKNYRILPTRYASSFCSSSEYGIQRKHGRYQRISADRAV